MGDHVTPYIVPAMLSTLAPFGIDWASIPIPGATEAANNAALLDICLAATSAVDVYCNMPLRATADLETLDGPDFRLTVRQSTGIAIAEMQHWPVIAVLGARMTPAGAFPRTWTSIPSAALDVGEPSAQFVGASSIPSGAGDGMNQVLIAPGYIDWINGRWGYTVQIAYLNGWPTAGIDQSAAAGATSIHVDDVTGFAGSRPQIWDAGSSETVTVISVAADNPVDVLPDVSVQTGPGTLTLASPGLAYSHNGSSPASAVIAAMPDVVREAAYYFAAAESMQRGSTQISVPALPGSMMSGGQPSIKSFISIAQQMLFNLRRVV